MATVTSNIDEVEALLNNVVGGFNFESPGIDGKGLANELLDIAAEGVLERTLVDQARPDGQGLAPNAAAYVARPDKSGKPVGVLEGEMLSLVEVKGTREIGPESATMEYGKSDPARRKAQWFTRGSSENSPSDIEQSGASNQPARPFYELDESIEAKMSEHAAKAADAYVGNF